MKILNPYLENISARRAAASQAEAGAAAKKEQVAPDDSVVADIAPELDASAAEKTARKLAKHLRMERDQAFAAQPTPDDEKVKRLLAD
jgi:hypothetical protein